MFSFSRCSPMTQNAGPMRVISVMSSLVMALRRVFTAAASPALFVQRQDAGFPLRAPGRANTQQRGQRRGGGGIFQAQPRNTAARTWKTRLKCRAFVERHDLS